MNELIIIRGLPGSGKTTIAKEMVNDDPGLLHFEADDYFINEDGEYIYRYNEIRNAHRVCRELVSKALADGKSVIVSNTFVKMWEIQPYIDLAEYYQADIRIITARGRYPNVHNVSEDVIRRMVSNWEPLYLGTRNKKGEK